MSITKQMELINSVRTGMPQKSKPVYSKPLLPIPQPNQLRKHSMKKKTKPPVLITLFCPEHNTSMIKDKSIVSLSEQFVRDRHQHKCTCGKELEYRNSTPQEIYEHVYGFLGQFKKQLDLDIVNWLSHTDPKMFGWIKRMRTNLIKQLTKDLPPEIRNKEILK